MHSLLTALGYFMLVGGHVLVGYGIVFWLMRRDERRAVTRAGDGDGEKGGGG